MSVPVLLAAWFGLVAAAQARVAVVSDPIPAEAGATHCVFAVDDRPLVYPPLKDGACFLDVTLYGSGLHLVKAKVRRDRPPVPPVESEFSQPVYLRITRRVGRFAEYLGASSVIECSGEKPLCIQK